MHFNYSLRLTQLEVKKVQKISLPDVSGVLAVWRGQKSPHGDGRPVGFIKHGVYSGNRSWDWSSWHDWKWQSRQEHCKQQSEKVMKVRVLIAELGAGFKDFFFSSLLGEMIQFDYDCSNGLKLPTSQGPDG